MKTMTETEIQIAKMIRMLADKTGISYQEAANQYETFIDDFLDYINSGALRD